MIVYHATPHRKNVDSIRAQGVLLPGKNLKHPLPCVHVSREPFIPGKYAVTTICNVSRRARGGVPAHNEAWILTLEVDDATLFHPDPVEEECFIQNRGVWLIFPNAPLPVRIVAVMYITDVIEWEASTPMTRGSFEQQITL